MPGARHRYAEVAVARSRSPFLADRTLNTLSRAAGCAHSITLL
jgi:hypothetical protein